MQKNKHAHGIDFESDHEDNEENLCYVLDPIVHDPFGVLQQKIQRLEAAVKNRDALIKLLREQELEKKRFVYLTWKKDCDQYFAQKRRTTFIAMPTPLESCKDKGCALRKDFNNSLSICKHDLASVYRASGRSLIPLLRTERLRWHPDAFANGCAAATRQELSLKAEKFFQILEEILNDELKNAGQENVQP